jgi:GMP synthase-like glutamine amidotransferase
MKLGILKADDVHPALVEEFGEYSDMVAAIMLDIDPTLGIEVFDVYHQQYPDCIDMADAYVITGSKCSVYDQEEWIYKLIDFVQLLHAKRKKMVGICFGHQLLAHSLGGKTEKSAKGWGVGVQTYHATKSGVGQGLAPRFELKVSHQDQVIDLPKNSVLLACNDFCPNAMFKLGNHILSLQGHPEFSKAYMHKLLPLRRERLGESLANQALNSLSIATQDHDVSKVIMEFLES